MIKEQQQQTGRAVRRTFTHQSANGRGAGLGGGAGGGALFQQMLQRDPPTPSSFLTYTHNKRSHGEREKVNALLRRAGRTVGKARIPAAPRFKDASAELLLISRRIPVFQP